MSRWDASVRRTHHARSVQFFLSCLLWFLTSLPFSTAAVYFQLYKQLFIPPFFQCVAILFFSVAKRKIKRAREFMPDYRVWGYLLSANSCTKVRYIYSTCSPREDGPVSPFLTIWTVGQNLMPFRFASCKELDAPRCVLWPRLLFGVGFSTCLSTDSGLYFI